MTMIMMTMMAIMTMVKITVEMINVINNKPSIPILQANCCFLPTALDRERFLLTL